MYADTSYQASALHKRVVILLISMYLLCADLIRFVNKS